MFNLSKQDEVKDKAANLASNVKSNVAQVTNEVKQDAEQFADNVQQKALETKHEAMNVIESLKSLLSQYTSSSNVSEIKDQILDKALQLKGVVKDEVNHAYEVGKERTVQTVHDKPIMSLAVAVGAGVLLGYILGTKTHSK